DLARQVDVLGLLGVDAQPAEMADAELGGTPGLYLDQVPEVIAEALGRAPVEAGPESRLAHRHTATLGHALVVVGDARNHVDVWVDVIHGVSSGVRGRKSDRLFTGRRLPASVNGVAAVPRRVRSSGKRPAGCVPPGRRCGRAGLPGLAGSFPCAGR